MLARTVYLRRDSSKSYGLYSCSTTVSDCIYPAKWLISVFRKSQSPTSIKICISFVSITAFPCLMWGVDADTVVCSLSVNCDLHGERGLLRMNRTVLNFVVRGYQAPLPPRTWCTTSPTCRLFLIIASMTCQVACIIWWGVSQLRWRLWLVYSLQEHLALH